MGQNRGVKLILVHGPHAAPIDLKWARPIYFSVKKYKYILKTVFPHSISRLSLHVHYNLQITVDLLSHMYFGTEQAYSILSNYDFDNLSRSRNFSCVVIIIIIIHCIYIGGLVKIHKVLYIVSMCVCGEGCYDT